MPVSYLPIVAAIIAWLCIAAWLFTRYAAEGGRMPLFRAGILTFAWTIGVFVVSILSLFVLATISARWQ